MIEHEAGGEIGTVWLNRSERRNALSLSMMDALREIFAAPPDPAARAILLRGRGPVFCSGLDLKQRDGSRVAVVEKFEAMLHAMAACPLPIVAVVQGDALAGGLELALHCDLVVASATAQFGMPLVHLGLAPNWRLTQTLTDLLGPVLTTKLLLLGNPVPASALHAAGAIAEIAPREELDALVSRITARLVGNAPLALRVIKAMTARQRSPDTGVAHDDIDAMVEVMRASEDAKEGLAARMEKRPPRFRGV